MLQPVKPVCKRALIRRDGTSVIFIQYCYSAEKRTLLNSENAIPPEYWNLKRLRINVELPTIYGDPAILNEQLQAAIRIAEDILSFAAKKKIVNPLAFLKKTFKPDFDLSLLEDHAKAAELPTVNLDVFFQIDEYIKSKARQVTPRAINLFHNMRDTLKAFENYRDKRVTFDSFDYNFYEEFVEYMAYEHIQRRKKVIVKGFKVSTIGKTIKQLRIFLRNRMRRKIIPLINLEDFKVIDEETDAVYLTWDEIIQIYQCDLLAYPHLGQCRSLFVFGCLTGLRFSDFSTIKSEDVRNRMLYKKQDKSDRWVVIPLKDEAYSIFIKEFNGNIPSITNSDFNLNIKEIAMLAGITQSVKFSHKKGNRDIVTTKPKHDRITSHTCRRSFCTNEFLTSTPVDLIMKISGHKGLKDFYRYIRISPEEAGQKIREIWQTRGDMSIVKVKDQTKCLPQLT